ncbi:Dot/Icm T4SS effector [Legionella nautarum]|uniref:Dot/Icm T4SS effector n=1 Tax=Legionella nautarum TaxID=45070 RepID=A0A0W0WW10_9GAMM|nr:hypothetical protein [Legionella nautarum]KTD36498.1 Dot/Icm T4SS effector [Legionella nautarum]
MTIYYYSVDVDGLVFNKKYNAGPQSPTKHSSELVITANQGYYDSIRAEAESMGATKRVLMIGTNRQDQQHDAENALMRDGCSSAFPALKKVSEYLGFELDTFLMADAKAGLESGASYDQIMKELEINPDADDWQFPKLKHETYIFDPVKRPLLIAQLQKAVLDNPGDEKIVFTFADDSVEILESLKRFFTKYEYLISERISFRLHFYDKGEIKEYAVFTGKGKSYENYRDIAKTPMGPFLDRDMDHYLHTLFPPEQPEVNENKAVEKEKSEVEIVEIEEQEKTILNNAANEGEKEEPIVQTTSAKAASNPLDLEYEKVGGYSVAKLYLRINKNNLSEEEVRSWFKGYLPPAISLEGEQYVLEMNASNVMENIFHGRQLQEEPSLKQAIEILYRQGFRMTDASIERLKSDLATAKCVFEEAQVLATTMDEGINPLELLESVQMAFIDMLDDSYPDLLAARRIAEQDLPQEAVVPVGRNPYHSFANRQNRDAQRGQEHQPERCTIS